MNSHGVEVKVRDRPYSESIEIYIVDKQTEKSTLVAKHVKLEFEEVDEKILEWPKPTLILSQSLVLSLYRALSKMFDKQGIKPDSQSKIEGILQAIKYHLEDMRKIVFSKENNDS